MSLGFKSENEKYFYLKEIKEEERNTQKINKGKKRTENNKKVKEMKDYEVEGKKRKIVLNESVVE